MNTKILSVVIPVYRVEKYLAKCLDSILVNGPLQSKVEVIVVNDGSPDNSLEIAKVYKERFPNLFKIINKENGGHGSAWNVGVEQATGKYIRFLDSDDWLDKDNFEKLIEKLCNTQVDLVFTHRNRYFEDSGKNEIDRLSNIPFDKEQRLDKFDLLGSNNGIEITNFWFCTYRTALLKQVHPLFLEHIIFDDGILFVAPILLASTFVCYDMVIYNYLLGREGQSMNAEIQKRKLGHRLKVQKSMISFVETHPTKSIMKKKFISAVLQGNIDGFTDQICELPAIERNLMLAKWTPYVIQNAKLYRPNKTLRAFKLLPLFLFNVFIILKKKVRN